MKRYFAAGKRRRMIIWTLLGARNDAFYHKHGGSGKEYKDLEFGKKMYPGIGFEFLIQ
jgi:hypothetical protein